MNRPASSFERRESDVVSLWSEAQYALHFANWQMCAQEAAGPARWQSRSILDEAVVQLTIGNGLDVTPVRHRIVAVLDAG